MVLYEDLRIYTIWRTDMARSASDTSSPRTAKSNFNKSAEEWEILGELADRLHHSMEAVEAYQNCLRVRFSPKAMRGVMGWYEKSARHGDVLQAMIRLIAWQYRWYSEVIQRTYHCVYSSRASSLTLNSSHRICYAPCASSLRVRVRSKFGALCRQLVCRKQCLI